MSITYTESLTVEAYNGLRKSVNWSAIEESLAKKGLEHTAFVISVEEKE